MISLDWKDAKYLSCWAKLEKYEEILEEEKEGFGVTAWKGALVTAVAGRRLEAEWRETETVVVSAVVGASAAAMVGFFLFVTALDDSAIWNDFWKKMFG